MMQTLLNCILTLCLTVIATTTTVSWAHSAAAVNRYEDLVCRTPTSPDATSPDAASLWVPDTSTAPRSITFSAQELEYLRSKTVITMCSDPDWMPFEGIKNGRHYGMSADYIAFFQQQLAIPIQLVATESWQQSLALAQQRQCDIFSLAASTPQRLIYMDFTRPYLSLPLVIATGTDKIFVNDIRDVQRQKIGAVEGYAITERLKSKYPQMNIVEVQSISDGLRRVESGELFGYIDNLMVIAEQIQKKFNGVIKISGRLDEQIDLAIATRNDEPLLRDIFDKLVASVTPEQQQQIFNNWVSVTQEVGFDHRSFWKLFGVFALIILLFSAHCYQLRKYNRKLLALSETDKLTGLYNRCKLDEILIDQEQHFLRYGTPCGIVMLDIDHFKKINDTFGHPVGDMVLIELATLMETNVRATDIVGRWGGEEFLIIAPSSGGHETTQMAEKLLAKLREHHFAEIGTITASCGVSSFSSGQDIKNTIRLADDALYRAKEGGRNRVVSSNGS